VPLSANSTATGGISLRAYLRAPIVVMVAITLVMLVIFTITSFQHGGSAGPPPTPYHFNVVEVTVTPGATP
jgi:hypothetical protein